MGSCLSSESRTPLPGSPSANLTKKKISPRKKGGGGAPFEPQTPGRLSANGATQFASLFTQQGKKGTNQDAMIVWENFGSRDNTIFCGVFDGHGPYGHMVARRVRDHLPQKLSAHWEVTLKSEEVLREINLNSSSRNSEDVSFASAEEESHLSADLNETAKQPDLFQILKESYLKAFKVMDRELRVHKSIDCFCSGTTAVTIVKQGNDLVVGNIGDSRAVLGTRDEDSCLIPVQLTVDLKPNLPAEAERIRRCRGRIFSLQDEPEVARVWLPNSDSPGLAMARAFGDFCLKEYGLISVPDVSHRRLIERDEFIVMATDGIWDVLSNKQVVDIVGSTRIRGAAAKALVESAVGAWKLKYPSSKVDDCAVVCLFLDTDRSSVSSSSACNMSRGKEALISAKEEGPSRSDDEAPVKTDWSALEGVTRVNTLVKLPRYVPDKKASGESKPLI